MITFSLSLLNQWCKNSYEISALCCRLQRFIVMFVACLILLLWCCMLPHQLQLFWLSYFLNCCYEHLHQLFCFCIFVNCGIITAEAAQARGTCESRHVNEMYHESWIDVRVHNNDILELIYHTARLPFHDFNIFNCKSWWDLWRAGGRNCYSCQQQRCRTVWDGNRFICITRRHHKILLLTWWLLLIHFTQLLAIRG